MNKLIVSLFQIPNQMQNSYKGGKLIKLQLISKHKENYVAVISEDDECPKGEMVIC